ncbi:hypothetical protein LOD99_14629 [Oopsacas minuta]|uniref:DDE-1 domain-containing protein n=1 Tax=Oopsacas minuta TaxID=111878 RepID=A0AAV7KHT4_9METZ|nr:hypothetical protein LOD99_14629 [Oopsacas minuta]
MSTIKSSHKSALTIGQRHNALRMLDDGKSERIVAEFFNPRSRNGRNWPYASYPTEREASANGVEGFKASEGWLSRVKARHGICGRALSGDPAGVEKVVLKNWEEDLPRVIRSYKPEDIYYLDETGLYFRVTTTTYLVLPKDAAHGIKQDKSRLTLMICTSMLGEKEKLLLIWKSEKPRALKGADMSKLPVVYKAQRKAWMTGLIFCSWMKDFDNRMYKSGRKILMFMDNASVHKASDELSLKAVQLTHFLCNTTSCTQPLDAGIIQSLKLLFRKQVHEHLLTHMVNIDNINKPNGDPYKMHSGTKWSECGNRHFDGT